MSVGEGNVGRERRAEGISRSREAADPFMTEGRDKSRSSVPTESEARGAGRRAEHQAKVLVWIPQDKKSPRLSDEAIQRSVSRRERILYLAQ